MGIVQRPKRQFSCSFSFWQIFPDVEGWPFPRYLGSCGRLVVSASTRPLRDFFGAAPEVAADLALQLLAVLRSMGTNDLNYFFYFTHVDAGTFGVFSNGHLFIRDASTLGIIDKEEGTQQAPSVAGGLSKAGETNLSPATLGSADDFFFCNQRNITC